MTPLRVSKAVFRALTGKPLRRASTFRPKKLAKTTVRIVPGRRAQFLLPITLASEPNRPTGEHWAAKRQRRMNQAKTVWWALTQHKADLPAFPVRVVLQYRSPRAMDADNLAAAFKGVRDQIADVYGRRSDAEAEGWKWVTRHLVRQKVGVMITITPLTR